MPSDRAEDSLSRVLRHSCVEELRGAAGPAGSGWGLTGGRQASLLSS